MEISTLLGQGFFLGVALSPTCLGVCLPLLLPYFSVEQRTGGANLKALGLFLGGRFLGYAMMGLLAGWIGRELLLQARLAHMLEGVVLAGLGLLLILFSLLHQFPQWSFCRVLKSGDWPKRAPLILGLLTGINICPPFLAVLLSASRSGGPGSGFLVLASFFVGTSLILLPLPAVGFLAKEKWIQITGRWAAGLIGLWFVFKGIVLLVS